LIHHHFFHRSALLILPRGAYGFLHQCVLEHWPK
jgi:hypothetical protein